MTAQSSGDSFAEVMARLRAGEAEAAAQVFRRFQHRLIALARSRLEARLRPKLDPEDVLQSVYKSFFLRCAGGELQLDSWDGLWGLLTVITLRKCGRWSERFHAALRDVSREVVPPAGEEEAGAAWEALDREPAPAEIAMLAETVEALLRDLGERDRAIVTLTLQGCSVAEVSAQLGRPQRTVYRVLERLKNRLTRVQTDSAQGP
jgi:RNA polymerase sigma-70 factor (ECF subfamily)